MAPECCYRVCSSAKRHRVVLWMLCCLALPLGLETAPSYIKSTGPGAPSRTKRAFIEDSVQMYLMNFGYLPQSDLETGNLRSEEQLKEAIANLQQFAGLEPTGELNAETKKLIHKRRCGVPDLVNEDSRKKRYTLRGPKWGYTNLTWRLRVPPNPKLMDPSTVKRELWDALEVWAENSRLTFRMVDYDDADIDIEFSRGYHGDGFPFDGRGKILAHAFFPGTGRGGDAHFDDDELWTATNSNIEEGTSLFSVAAHEFGHSLGLSHSSVEGALMYPWYQGTRNTDEKFRLPDDDRFGIEQLYGRKHDRPYPTRGPRPTPSTTTTPPPRYTPPTHRPRPDRPYDRPERPHERPERPHERPERPHERPERPHERPERPHERPERPHERPERPHERPERPHDRPERPQPPKADDKPNTCDTSYDAVSLIRGELFIFKGRYFWRLNKDHMRDGYPVEITRFWNNLPANLTHIDAVYESLEKEIVFFIGKEYYVFDGIRKLEGYPRPLTHLGLPESLEKIDGAMVWGHNSKTYFFSGTMYWRLEEYSKKVELDYPRDMKMWRGVGYNIDSVFKDHDGVTYFFKGKGFWKFNDRRMRVDKEGQLSSASYWMHCPVEEEREFVPENPYEPSRSVSICVCFQLYVFICIYEFSKFLLQVTSSEIPGVW